MLYEWDDLEGAEKRVREGIQANAPWKNFVFDAIGYSDLVSVQQARGNLPGAVETMQQLEKLLEGRTEIMDFAEELITIQVRLWMAKGDMASAETWADQMAQAEPLNYLQGWGYLTLARVRAFQGRLGEAQQILEMLAHQPNAGKRVHRQVRVDLFLAILLARQNQWDQALQTLEACLSQAEPGGYRRLFLDAGAPVKELLSAYLRQNTGGHKDYAQKMLDAFPKEPPEPSPAARSEDFIEPLTTREKEVLSLMAEGLSNRQIAEKLVLSEGTIKFHVHSILEKIQVHSRTQAIVKAKELHLV